VSRILGKFSVYVLIFMSSLLVFGFGIVMLWCLSVLDGVLCCIIC